MGSGFRVVLQGNQSKTVSKLWGMLAETSEVVTSMKLFVIEVFYNKSGLFYNPDAQVRTRASYHQMVMPVWANNKEEAEEKVGVWFSREKSEYKVIQLLTNQALE